MSTVALLGDPLLFPRCPAHNSTLSQEPTLRATSRRYLHFASLIVQVYLGESKHYPLWALGFEEYKQYESALLLVSLSRLDRYAPHLGK